MKQGEVIDLTMTAPADTATRTTSLGASVVLASQPIPRPATLFTRDEVVTLICREARVARDVASRFLQQIESYARTKHSVNHPDTVWLNAYHHVLEVVMPDDVASPAPGTAHAAINHHLSTGEKLVAVVHINTSPTRERRNCAVKIERRTVSV
jgi:hypothetical protein